MEIICKANESILSILKRFKKTADKYRLMRYCVQTQTEDGVLLLNVLTREMVLLTQSEYDNITEIQELKDRWFVVPQHTDEKELTDFVRWVLQTRQKKPKYITGYTIFPTTDCNARCFYCFELKRSRIAMNNEIAEKTVRYIKDHCGGEKVSISWFGGEPLFNQPAIDTICVGLQREKIEFTSSMISNGYLFDDCAVKKAVDDWKLKRVQITLDGTEEIYNRSKAYIYREGSAYQVVLGNIEKLLKAGIFVSIRLNVDLYNAQNLLALVDELAARFHNQMGLTVYTHLIFDADRPMAETYSEEESDRRDEALRLLEEKIIQVGLAPVSGIRKSLVLQQCKADNGKSVTILPTGDIGLCDFHSEDEFIGHIDREEFDEAVVKSWKEKSPEIPECADCFRYPECVQLKKCTSKSICFRQLRQERLRKTQWQMMNEYHYWLRQDAGSEAEDDELC